MILGPVFRGELLRTARRGRYYWLRFLYGGILLFLVWSGYQERFWDTSTATIAAVAEFAELTFVRFAIVQLVTILLLIPPIFGGSIVDEKQRKTLHYLMASQLSGTEIILDKVLGRLPHLVVFLAMGLPIVSILGLFGGIPLDEVIFAYVGTSSIGRVRPGDDDPGLDPGKTSSPGDPDVLPAHAHLVFRATRDGIRRPGLHPRGL